MFEMSAKVDKKRPTNYLAILQTRVVTPRNYTFRSKLTRETTKKLESS